eukprot:SAG22_NODE_4_length_44774_cov_362.122149_6_plen_77_part_00
MLLVNPARAHRFGIDEFAGLLAVEGCAVHREPPPAAATDGLDLQGLAFEIWTIQPPPGAAAASLAGREPGESGGSV